MTNHVHVFSNADAWNVAKTHIQDASKDADASSRAGYDVFRSESDYYSYICDLGDRLEVNLSNGDNLNVWIDEKPVEVKKPGKARNNKEEKNMEKKLEEKKLLLDVLSDTLRNMDWLIKAKNEEIEGYEQSMKEDPESVTDYEKQNAERAKAYLGAWEQVKKHLEKLL